MQCVSINILEDSIVEESENFTVYIRKLNESWSWFHLNPHFATIVIEGNVPTLFYTS